jgi:hypothetical protein
MNFLENFHSHSNEKPKVKFGFSIGNHFSIFHTLNLLNGHFA